MVAGAETAMGVSIGAQLGNNAEYVTAIHDLGEILMKRVFSPWIAADFIFYKTPMGRKFKQSLNTLHSFTRTVIEERKSQYMEALNGKPVAVDTKPDDNIYLSDKKRRRLAFLDLLLDYHVKDNALTIDDMREEVDTFMFEGHDTTSVSMSWTLYLLGRHPKVQDRLHEELDAVFGTDITRDITAEDIARMTYLDAVLKESLRMYPSVPFIGRKLNEDFRCRDYVIPKDTNVFLFIERMHYDPEVFPEPLRFLPERFLENSTSNINAYTYVPFSAGARSCIGKRFAVTEEKIILAKVCLNFRLESLEPLDKIQPSSEMVFRAKDALNVSINGHIWNVLQKIAMITLEEKKQKVLQFNGAMVAPFTPFDDNGEVDVSQIPAYLKYLVDSGVDGLYICGTTGEGYSLTNDEKVAIVSAWRQAIDAQSAGHLLSIVNVSSTCLKESLQLSRKVQDLGFDAIAVLPPIYYKPTNVDEWVDYMRAFTIAAPQTPLYYYHNALSVVDIMKAVAEGVKQLPQFSGFKFADKDFVRFSLLQKNFGKQLKFFMSSETMLLASLTGLDCSAANCVVFNFARVVESYKLMVKHVRDGDLESARRQQNIITEEGQRHRTAANFFVSAKHQFNQDVKHLVETILQLTFGFDTFAVLLKIKLIMATLAQKKQKVLQFSGAMVAPFTPFDDNGEVDVSQIPAYLKYLVDSGVDGLYICGTTGEGYSLTNDEKVAIVSAWRQAIDAQSAGHLLSVVNVSSTCLKESLQLSRKVQDLGFDAIAVLPPIYYKPTNVGEWVDYMRTFTIAAPQTPLYYYHNAKRVVDIMKAVAEGVKQLPQFSAFKFADSDFVRFSLLQKNFGKQLKFFMSSE
ncbi:unnamed protein product, partial [Medioppia subpectinata]